MKPRDVDSERLRRLDVLLAAALELDETARRHLLTGCPAELRDEVEKLLAYASEEAARGSPVSGAPGSVWRAVALRLGDEPRAAADPCEPERAPPAASAKTVD